MLAECLRGRLRDCQLRASGHATGHYCGIRGCGAAVWLGARSGLSTVGFLPDYLFGSTFVCLSVYLHCQSYPFPYLIECYPFPYLIEYPTPSLYINRYVLHVGANGTVQAVLTALSGGDQLTVLLSSTTEHAVVVGPSMETRSDIDQVVERSLTATAALPPKCGVHLVDDTVSDSGEFTGGIPLASLHVTVPAPQGSGCDPAHSFVDNSGCADVMGCLVYVSVYGGTAASGAGQPHSAGSNASYTVRASLRPDPPALTPGTANTVFPLVVYSLADGVPQADSIVYRNPEGSGHTLDPMNLWRYYAYQTEAGHEPLSVISQATVGYLNLYVLRCPYRTGKECAFHGVLPNTTKYLATSAR